MSDITDILSSTQQLAANYEAYADLFEDSSSDLVNSETFLNLLVAEMTNQDPLEPTSNTEFITQMATFTQLQYAQDTSKYAMATYASSLVGQTVTASSSSGGSLVTETGVVDQIVKNGDSYTVYVNGTAFDLSAVTVVSATTSTDTTTDTSTTSSSDSLAATIAAASMMIGMYATVCASTDSGDVYDAGIVDSIQVKDGEITIIINDIAYNMSDVVDVRYASYSDYDDTEEDETVEAVDETETVETDTEDEDLEDLVETEEDE